MKISSTPPHPKSQPQPGPTQTELFSPRPKPQPRRRPTPVPSPPPPPPRRREDAHASATTAAMVLSHRRFLLPPRPLCHRRRRTTAGPCSSWSGGVQIRHCHSVVVLHNHAAAPRPRPSSPGMSPSSSPLIPCGSRPSPRLTHACVQFGGKEGEAFLARSGEDGCAARSGRHHLSPSFRFLGFGFDLLLFPSLP